MLYADRSWEWRSTYSVELVLINAYIGEEGRSDGVGDVAACEWREVSFGNLERSKEGAGDVRSSWKTKNPSMRRGMTSKSSLRRTAASSASVQSLRGASSEFKVEAPGDSRSPFSSAEAAGVQGKVSFRSRVTSARPSACLGRWAKTHRRRGRLSRQR